MTIDTSATELNGKNITLHWIKPVVNPLTELPIEGYKVYTNEGYRTYDFVLNKDIPNYDLTQLKIADLIPGLEYGFKVSAYNKVGEGEKSDTHYAYAMTTPGKPDIPIRVSSSKTSATEASIELRWEPVFDTGLVPLTGYKLYQRDTVTDTTSVAYDGTGSPTTLTYTVLGLVLDRDYEFWVTSMNSLESKPSDRLTLRAAGLPDTPGAITEVSRTSVSIELSWPTVTQDGGSPILAYTLVEEIYNQNSGELTNHVRYFGATTTALVDDLVAGNTYTFKVKCTNMVGDSEFSDAYSFKIVDAPSSPVNLIVSSFGETQVTLSWSVPLSSGGQTISGYTVYRKLTSDSTSSFAQIGTPGASVFTYTDSTVAPGVKYAYRVSATNGYQEGEYSDTVEVRTIASPSGMAKPVFVANTATTITLSWSNPSVTGSSAVEYFVLMMKPEFENTYKVVYQGLSKFFTVSDLQSGFSYLFKVKAVNDAGESPLSPSSDPIYAAEPPEIPENLTLVSRSSSQIRIRWTAPKNTGGLPITGYKVYKAVGSGVYVEDAGAPSKNNPGVRVYEDTAVTSGTLYSFKVSAVNKMGESLMSKPVKVIAATLPNKPTNPPTVVVHSATSVTVSLTPIPAGSNGGSAITGYIVMMDNGLGDDSSFSIKSDSLQTSLTLTGLVVGRTYRVKYAGRNRVYDQNNMYKLDELLFSETSQFTAASNPSKPRNLRQSGLCYRNSIVIEWDPPSSVSSPITEYVVTHKGTTTVTTTLSNVDSYTITNLTPGQKYEINIKAVTAFGDSGFLSEPLVAYPGVVPTSPSAVTFDSVTRNSIVVSWTALIDEDTGGTAVNPIVIDSYNLYMRKSTEEKYQLVAKTSSTTFTVRNLKAGTMYKFKLSATNIIGESSLSSSNEMVPGTSPSSPGKPSVTVRYPTEVYIAWTEPFDSGGASITSYTVTITKTSDSSTQEFIVIDSREFIFNSGTGVSAGEKYTVSVKANNFVTDYFVAKTGASSAQTQFSTSVLPTAVPELVLSTLTRSSATVTWTLLATDAEKGYSTTDPVYILEADDGSGGEFYVINSSTTDTSKALTGITPGTLLRLRMRVQNVVGYSAYSQILTVRFAEVPDAPAAPVFVNRSGDDENGMSPYITISWKEPSDTGGSEVLGYKVELQENLGAWTEAYEGSTSPDVLTWKFEGLNAGSAYNFRVYARNDVGYSVASASTLIYCGTVPYSMTTQPRLASVTITGSATDIQNCATNNQ